MDLAAYLLEHDQTQRDLARAIGITEAHMSRLVNGKSRPSAELAEKIEAATAGKVTFKSLMLAARAIAPEPQNDPADGEPQRAA